MLLSNRLVPRLPTTLTGADDDARRPFGSRLSRRSRWVIAAALISLLLHLAALFIILREPPHAPLDNSQATAPVEWQVETSPNKTSSAPESSSTPSPPPTPAPQQPTPQPTPTPQVEPQPEKPVERQEEAKPTPPQPETPPAPQRPAAPPSSTSPDGVLFRPEQQTPPAPQPPPPPPPKPVKEVPKPQATKPVIPLSPMLNDTPFAQRPVPKQPPSSRPPSPQQQNRDAMDLSIGPVERFAQEPPRRNESDMSSDVQVEGAQLGSDWLRQLHEWWIEHRRYPEEAIRDRESGTVIIRIEVDRHGYTSNPEILQHSGSRWLDLQTLATFGHTKLPAFPVNTPEDHATLTLIVRYEIY